MPNCRACGDGTGRTGGPGPALQCLSRRFDLQPTDPECRDLCDVGLDLDAAVRSVAAKSAEAVAFREKRLKSFIVVLKQKGYFNGVEEGQAAEA